MLWYFEDGRHFEEDAVVWYIAEGNAVHTFSNDSRVGLLVREYS